MNNELMTLICFGLAFVVGMLPIMFGDQRRSTYGADYEQSEYHRGHDYYDNNGGEDYESY